MTSRVPALGVAVVAILLVLAQLAFPATPLYHTWQYALALALALVVLLGYANAARRGEDGLPGRRLALAMAGAAIVDLAGLASGLLGPDTATIAGTPGTVVPIPALGAAAAFAPADADAIARGRAAVGLRRRGAGELAIDGGARRLVGESLLYLQPEPAAYVEATDARGAHLTITQPTNASFLSPVLLFRDRQRIGGLSVPLETFATPATKRVFRALYFTPADLATFRRDAGELREPALVMTAASDDGRPLGVALARSGVDTTLGDVRLRVTIGSYPALAIAAAPEPWALVAGLLLFVGGLAWAGWTARGIVSECAASPSPY